MRLLRQAALLRVIIAAQLMVLLAVICAGCGHSSRTSSPTRFLAVISEGPAIPISAAGHAGGMVAGDPVVAGGSHWSADKSTKRWLHECFVFRDGKWSPGPSLPHPWSDCAYASFPGGMIIAGGNDGKNPIDKVLQLNGSPDHPAWKPLTSLPETIEAASGAIISNTIYVAGGYAGGKPSSRLWALDLSVPGAAWKSLAPLPAPGRGWAAMVAVDSKLYHFGGFVYPPFTEKVTVFGDAHCYDPSQDKWTRLEGFDMTGYGWTATAVDNQSIMLTGRCPKVSETSDDILLLNLRTLETKKLGTLPGHGCCMPAIPMGEKTWWIPGGEPDTNKSRTAKNSIITLSDGSE